MPIPILAVGLLGTILEQISGKSYEQMVEEIICKPLGMNSTVQHFNPQLSQRFVKVYNEDGKETPPWNFDALAPCGSLKSTVNDLLTMSKPIWLQQTPNFQSISANAPGYFHAKDLKLGLGWHIIVINNVEYYFHNGGTYGCSSFLGIQP